MESRLDEEILNAMAANAANVCNALDVAINLVEGDSLRTRGRFGPLRPGGFPPIPVTRDTISGAAILDARTVNVPDTRATDDFPMARHYSDEIEVRTSVACPLINDGVAFGSILARRLGVDPFSEREVAMLETFAQLAATTIQNTRLLDEVEARNRDLAEALEREQATGDVLRTIAGSPTEIQPVLDAICERSAELVGANDAVLRLVEGDMTAVAAHYGDIGTRQVVPNSLLPAVEARRPVQVDALLQDKDPDLAERARLGILRTMLSVPLLRGDQVIGLLNFRRRELQFFTDHQIALLQTFADQAVIALENARLFREINERNAELRETLEQQTATADVLKVIASSPTDIQPVLDAIVHSATNLCGADAVTIRFVEGHRLHAVARFGRFRRFDEIPVDRNTITARAVVDRRRIFVRDTDRETGPNTDFPDDGGIWEPASSVIAVPLSREETAIGVLTARMHGHPFSDRQAALLETFAAQAVIAIQNVRLFKEINERNAELREALDQQTATAEVLRIIGSNPTELQLVLDAICENAAKVCGATNATIRLVNERQQLVVASRFGSLQSQGDPLSLDGSEATAPAVRALREGRVINISDVLHDPAVVEAVRGHARDFGFRAAVVVPLRRENESIGVIQIRRAEPGAFSDKHVQLLQTFADQAVIAIENARLFNDLKEALEHQTATSEVLDIIAGSPTDTQPVFDAIVNAAARLCAADATTIRFVAGDRLRVAARFGPSSFSDEVAIDRATMQGRAVLDARTLYAPHPAQNPGSANAYQTTGQQSSVAVPLRREGEVVGVLTARSERSHAFSPKRIALLETFADQAVIAIENVRLFREINERNAELHEALDRQTATGEVLQIISRSHTDVQPVLQAIVEAATRILRSANALVWRVTGTEIELAASFGESQVPRAMWRQVISHRGAPPVVAVVQQQTIHIPDTEALTDDEFHGMKQRARTHGLRSLLALPMWREDEVVGVIGVDRHEANAFRPEEIALVETFAAQAVIAIENVRLFEELQEKNAELGVASQHKSDFLANMSHELRTPLNAIISFSEILQEDAEDAGDEQYVPDLQEITSAGKHLLGLINDILDLSKIEAGRMDVFLETFSLADVLREVQAVAQPLVEKKGNVLLVEASADLGEMHSDLTKLKQSLLNLLSNAAKFTEQGTITLRVAHSTDASAPSAIITFSVTDTGIGMTDEQLGRLFQAFSQADASTSRKYGGTGLGLALTRQFCQLLGGDVAVASSPGVGSTFTITLPADARVPAGGSPP